MNLQSAAFIRQIRLSRYVLAAAALTLIAAGAVMSQSPTKPHAKAVIQIWMWGGPSSD